MKTDPSTDGAPGLRTRGSPLTQVLKRAETERAGVPYGVGHRSFTANVTNRVEGRSACGPPVNIHGGRTRSRPARPSEWAPATPRTGIA